VRTFGILNLTRDSFSDGGRFLDAGAALAHGQRLLADGADVLDVGAESTHPDAEVVPVAEEIRRLAAVVPSLVAAGASISVDTHKPEVMREALAMGARWLNDVRGFRSAEALAVVAEAPLGVRFVAMFARNAGARAERQVHDHADLVPALLAFVAERRAAFAAVGIAPERLVLDPGMGFFLGAGAGPSLHVLRHLPKLFATGGEWLVSCSRKSFVGVLTGQAAAERGPGSLAAELWAARAGVHWVRTHAVRALRDAWTVERAIAAVP
jgi:dihydropteroate synthase type 2